MDLVTHLFVKPAPFYPAQDHPPNVPASLGYAPCYVANLAVPSFGNRDEKVIATLTWHFMWQRQRLKNHLEAPLKPSLGINPGRNGPVIKSNDSNTTEFFCKQYCTYLLPGLWRGFGEPLAQALVACSCNNGNGTKQSH